MIGLFCTPDSLNITEKTPTQLNDKRNGCEAFRFISGIDEMALPCEIGLWFGFKNRGNGFPTGCPGLMNLDGVARPGQRLWQVSNIDGVKSDPMCDLQTMSHPAWDQPTSWYMRHYATDQDSWLRDFVTAFDKMMSNGYHWPWGLN